MSSATPVAAGSVLARAGWRRRWRRRCPGYAPLHPLRRVVMVTIPRCYGTSFLLLLAWQRTFIRSRPEIITIIIIIFILKLGREIIIHLKNFKILFLRDKKSDPCHFPTYSDMELLHLVPVSLLFPDRLLLQPSYHL